MTTENRHFEKTYIFKWLFFDCHGSVPGCIFPVHIYSTLELLMIEPYKNDRSMFFLNKDLKKNPSSTWKFQDMKWHALQMGLQMLFQELVACIQYCGGRWLQSLWREKRWIQPCRSPSPVKLSSKKSRMWEKSSESLSRWWFQICFIFTPTWGNDPIALIFFRWVETTN